jgi:hypothetical protein
MASHLPFLQSKAVHEASPIVRDWLTALLTRGEVAGNITSENANARRAHSPGARESKGIGSDEWYDPSD